ncbi:alpha/beta hydrolase [Lentzea nigeriaca]|uniref:alpha/beta hydrolase n=1 Tax=Lentzea nigeriaca TaxID=1128665 RepID=UPI001957967E|nr:alpha/beta hydrolase [Lentzea nigeriaca]MBM7856674.1 pimeloyl-ACP methyl ester carboxylesterase [Lentzea nigeriaca]
MKFLAWALTGVLVAGCSPAAHATDAPVPVLSWTDCADGFECATAEVPLDHRDPSGEKIELGVTRKRAADPSRRIGSLFVNPGGPGSGVDGTVRYFATDGPAELRDRFDIIGFDPRGVGRSQPLACQPQDEYAKAWQEASARPRKDSYESAVRNGRAFADACQRESAKLLPFIGTEYVARDMDLLRQAVGDEKLNYLGISYGSYIGTVYASLFPQNIRVLALDGAYNPHTYANYPYEYDLGQYRAVEAALGRFFDWCVATSCEFGDGDPRAAFVKLQNELDADPVVDDGTFVGNGATLTYNVVSELDGGKRAWPELATRLAEAQNRTGPLLAVPDVGFLSVNVAVECADRVFPRGQLKPRLTIASAVAPLTGPALAYAVPNYDHAHATACTQWPVVSRSRYAGPFTAAGAPPILVVGNTGDPDTPYQDSVALVSTLRSGHLLTHRGEGHTGFFQSEKCVAEKITAYLAEGALPPQGAFCED